MKGHDLWSYAPYRPLLRNVGDIYICRIAPDEHSIHLEWLDTGATTYRIFCSRKTEESFSLCGETDHTSFDIENLGSDTDYRFYVCANGKESRIRLARTGKPEGTVVNYLHPDDDAYAFSGRYLCSPSLVRHPDGYLLASMDVFAVDHPQNLTLIFRSDDDGKSWHYVSELMPCFWGKMFIHNGELYMLSCSTEYGDLLIGKSTDGGKTFSAPVALLRGSNGKNGNDGIHKNPQNILIHNGRLYNTLEWGSWHNQEYCHAVMVMSCDIHDDLLVPENWHFSEPLKYDPTWPGTAKGETQGNIEGTLCVAPDSQLYNVMRYNIRNAVPAYGLVLAYRVNTNDPDAPLEYSHAIEMPGNNVKFMIKYDSVSQAYYAIICRIDGPEHIYARNLLSLMRSRDMEKWEVVCDLIDRRADSPMEVGFQYVDFEIEGDDILYLSRTAINGAHNFHDSNYSTFHRIKNFRNL